MSGLPTSSSRPRPGRINCACRPRAATWALPVTGRCAPACLQLCRRYPGGGNGLAEAISRSEARGILEESKALIGPNWRQCTEPPHLSLQLLRLLLRHDERYPHFNIRHAIVTSNWLMDVTWRAVTAAGVLTLLPGECAIAIAEQKEDGAMKGGGGLRRRWAVRMLTFVWAGGTCHGACKFGAIQMTPREQRVLTPESTFLDRRSGWPLSGANWPALSSLTIRKAEPPRPGRVICSENSPPAEAALAVRPCVRPS